MLTRLVLVITGFGFFPSLVLGFGPPNFVEITLESLVIPADLGDGSILFFLKDIPVPHKGISNVEFEKGRGFCRSVSSVQFSYKNKNGSRLKLDMYMDKSAYDRIQIMNNLPVKVTISIEGTKVHQKEYSKGDRKISITGNNP